MGDYKKVDSDKSKPSSGMRLVGLVAFAVCAGWLAVSGVLPLSVGPHRSYRTTCHTPGVGALAFCESFTNPWTAEEEYVAMRSQCKWRVDNRTLIRKHFSNSFDYRRYYLFSKFEEHNDRIHICDLNGEDDTLTHIQRIGPNVGRGGFDWLIQAYEMDISPIKDTYVTSLMRGPVAVSDERTLGFPPLHMHHYHINYDPGESLLTWKACPQGCGNGGNGSLAERGFFTRVISAHGDQMCSVADGGASCFVEKFPLGYGMKMRRSTLYFNAYMNDVRPPKSDPLRFWLDVGFMATRKKQRSVATMTFVSPFEMDFSIEAISHVDPISFYIPFTLTDVPTAQWYSCHFAVTGRFLWNYVHMHMVPLNNVVIIKNAVAADLGLDQRFRGDEKGRPWPLPGPDAEHNFKQWLMGNLKELQKKCDDTQCKKRPEVACDLLPITEMVDGKLYDRRIDATSCANWEFEKTDKIFVIQFNKEGDYQHAFFRGYWEALDDSSEIDHHHSFCSHTGVNQDENGFSVKDIERREPNTPGGAHTWQKLSAF